MLMFGQREDVGVVGAKLYYPDDTIQHAGIILGLGGAAGHCHYKAPRYSAGYFGRLIYPQNFSAVTGACMLVKKDIFEKVGGLEKEFAVAFNDVDLCMKIREQGYLVCWTPFAELYHYESLTRGTDLSDDNKRRFKRETDMFMDKWSEVMKKGDPYYNINLSLEKSDFSLK